MEAPVNEICVGISETASEALETPIEELPPLADVIDPDALDRIGSTTDHDSPQVTVIFEYAGLELLVHSEEVIYARPSDGGSASPDSRIR